VRALATGMMSSELILFLPKIPGSLSVSANDPMTQSEKAALAAITGLVEAASEAKQHGTFRYLERTVTTAELYTFLPE
jgi:hypothetical protein